jgi:hypothetical protein
MCAAPLIAKNIAPSDVFLLTLIDKTHKTLLLQPRYPPTEHKK